MKNHLNNDSGFSIIEVLLGAVVFMVGFSLLVGMLSNIYAKFSIKEMQQGSIIANEEMILAIQTGQINNIDTIIVKDGIKYKMTKKRIIEGNIVKISIAVSRLNTKKEIIKLYNEICLP